MFQYEEKALPKRTFFSNACEIYKDACEQIPECDLIQLHWVAGFIDYKVFFTWLPPELPLVWTLHDMANFTGGCSYDLSCGKFVQQCGTCPQLGSTSQIDLSRQVWRRKQKYYASLDIERVRIVTPSRWLGKEVERSSLLGRFNWSVIPYGLNTEVFQPRDGRVAREVLGIPQDAQVLLFISSNAGDYLKGFHLLAEALAGVEGDKTIFLLSVGKGFPPRFNRFRHAHFQDIHNDRLLSFIYSASDVYVAPSLGDNLPNTVLESISCGTPVVAFSTGGIPDMVRPGVTGLLATAGDSADLRAAILEILSNNEKRTEMSIHCRRVALAEYDLSVQARRYLEIYREMLNRNADLNPVTNTTARQAAEFS
jgi:glycosyltransferase involved in cell wall biosynthesis